MTLSRLSPTDAASLGFGPPSLLDMTDSEHKTMLCHSRFPSSSSMTLKYLPYMPDDAETEDDSCVSQFFKHVAAMRREYKVSVTLFPLR
jgi:hypothetical protein